MKNILLVLSSVALTQTALAGDGPGNSSFKFAQSCLGKDTQSVQKSQPIEIDRAIKNLTFQSEIFYQIVFNRTSIVENNKELVGDYKALDNAWNKKLAERDAALEHMGDWGKLNDSQKEAYELIAEKYENELNQAKSNRSQFLESLGANPKLGQYMTEIEKALREGAETDDRKKEDLKFFLADKSYGDYMIKMASSAKSCGQLHEQYKKLAVEAKAKRNFKLATISSLHSVDLERVKETEVTKEIRHILNEAGYRKAAEGYTYQKNSTLAYVVANGALQIAISQVTGGKASNLDFDFGPKDQTAQQIEASFNGIVKKGMLERHVGMAAALSGILK